MAGGLVLSSCGNPCDDILLAAASITQHSSRQQCTTHKQAISFTQQRLQAVSRHAWQQAKQLASCILQASQMQCSIRTRLSHRSRLCVHAGGCRQATSVSVAQPATDSRLVGRPILAHVAGVSVGLSVSSWLRPQFAAPAWMLQPWGSSFDGTRSSLSWCHSSGSTEACGTICTKSSVLVPASSRVAHIAALRRLHWSSTQGSIEHAATAGCYLPHTGCCSCCVSAALGAHCSVEAAGGTYALQPDCAHAQQAASVCEQSNEHGIAPCRQQWPPERRLCTRWRRTQPRQQADQEA